MPALFPLLPPPRLAVPSDGTLVRRWLWCDAPYLAACLGVYAVGALLPTALVLMGVRACQGGLGLPVAAWMALLVVVLVHLWTAVVWCAYTLDVTETPPWLYVSRLRRALHRVRSAPTSSDVEALLSAGLIGDARAVRAAVLGRLRAWWAGPDDRLHGGIVPRCLVAVRRWRVLWRFSYSDRREAVVLCAVSIATIAAPTAVAWWLTPPLRAPLGLLAAADLIVLAVVVPMAAWEWFWFVLDDDNDGAARTALAGWDAAWRRAREGALLRRCARRGRAAAVGRSAPRRRL